MTESNHNEQTRSASTVRRKSFEKAEGQKPFHKAPRILWVLFAFSYIFIYIFYLTGVHYNWKVNFFQNYHQDKLWVILALFLITIAWHAPTTSLPRTFSTLISHISIKYKISYVILFTFFTIVFGTIFVYHNFTISLDETLLKFQATVFQQGYGVAPVQEEWKEFSHAIQHIFMRESFDGGYWYPGYRPGSALLAAFFGLFGLEAYFNAFLAAGSAFLLASIARQLWPERNSAPIIAILLMVTSAQFLFTAMSMYAMTSHLFFNLLWLFLFLKDDRRTHILAALVGAYAIGLHQFFIHPFFVLPFMIDLLRQRRLKLVAFYGAVYLCALLFWINWAVITIWIQDGIFITSEAKESGILYEKALSYILSHTLTGDLLFWASNFVRFVAWQNIATLLLLIVTVAQWKVAPRPIRLLGLSVLTSLIPYVLLMQGQGHGWGYRYLHVHLGTFALMAVFGWYELKSRLDRERWIRWRRAIIGLALASTVIGLPLRAWQVEAFLDPFRKAMASLRERSEDVVLVDRFRIWYGADLIRNDPFLNNKPKFMDPYRLTDSELRNLCSTYNVAYVGQADLAEFGVRRLKQTRIDANLEINGDVLPRLKEAGCQINTAEITEVGIK